MTARYSLLALAHPRAGWFREVARWCSSAAVPADYTVCVTAAQALAHLESDRPYSALLVDAGVPGADRDLFVAAAARGCAAVVVDDGSARRDWASLGARAVLPALFDRQSLVGLLEGHALPVDELHRPPGPLHDGPVGDEGPGGTLVAVVGPPASGTSTVARALAQGFGGRRGGTVLLADLALHADQGMLHDTGDVVPGLQEVVDAHRHGQPGREAIRAHTWSAPHLPYDLLLGLRRHRDWAALRAGAVEATLASLRRCYPVVVADVTPDLEGERETGSPDVEDRNRLARRATATADLVVVTGQGGTWGLHRLVRVLHDLDTHGVPAARRQVVLVGVPRRPARRAALVEALHRLTDHGHARAGRPPVFVPTRNDLEAATRDGVALPAPFVEPLTKAVEAAIRTVGHEAIRPEPALGTPIQPGSLGGWWLEGEAMGA